MHLIVGELTVSMLIGFLENKGFESGACFCWCDYSGRGLQEKYEKHWKRNFTSKANGLFGDNTGEVSP